MKRTNALFAVLFVISIILISGCSSQKANFRDFRGRGLNLTEEERQQMINERQQFATEACQNKSEGDSCQIENPGGSIEGICNIAEENLICTINRTRRPEP